MFIAVDHLSFWDNKCSHKSVHILLHKEGDSTVEAFLEACSLLIFSKLLTMWSGFNVMKSNFIFWKYEFFIIQAINHEHTYLHQRVIPIFAESVEHHCPLKKYCQSPVLRCSCKIQVFTCEEKCRRCPINNHFYNTLKSTICWKNWTLFNRWTITRIYQDVFHYISYLNFLPHAEDLSSRKQLCPSCHCSCCSFWE